jgi:hypothetical protein
MRLVGQFEGPDLESVKYFWSWWILCVDFYLSTKQFNP